MTATTEIVFTHAEINAYVEDGVWTELEAEAWREKAPVEFEGEVRRILEAGPDVPWREWVPKYYLRRECLPFAPFHEKLWDWFDDIELDTKHRSAVVPWSRGLGKSTILEGGIARVCVKGTRRFVLYVSRTLDDANNHVTAIARVLENMGIGRKTTKYGLAIGWSANKLVADNGFNLLAFGLDAGQRGVKLEDARPDLICLDDIDHLGDSEELIEKKCRIIANTIMMAGSTNFTGIFVQNPIGPHTVMSRVLDGRLGILADRDRELTKLIPAINNIEYEYYYDDLGLERGRITGGESVWEGKTIEDWQYLIDKSDMEGFLVECQHEIYIGATFFDKYNPENHVVTAKHTPRGMEGPNFPTWYSFFGGYDWGYDDDDPSAFSVCAIDELGRVHCVQSWHINKDTNDAFAAKVCATLAEWGIPKSECPIYADGSMWAEKTINGKKAEPDIQAFYRAGLKMVKCSQGALANRHRNTTIRNWLAGDGKLIIYRGYNKVLEDSFKNASPQKKDRNQIQHNMYSHIAVAIGNALSSQPDTPTAPETERTPDQEREHLQKIADDNSRFFKEVALKERNKRIGLIPKLDDDKKEMRDEGGNLIWTAAKKVRR